MHILYAFNENEKHISHTIVFSVLVQPGYAPHGITFPTAYTLCQAIEAK